MDWQVCFGKGGVSGWGGRWGTEFEGVGKVGLEEVERVRWMEIETKGRV